MEDCESLSQSDAPTPHSTPTPLCHYFCRTNYQLMDSRLITGATGSFKLAGQQRRNWSDGDGREGRKEREADGGTAPEGDG